MALDLSSVGFTTEPRSFTYDWKTLALYALGIGAKRDELDYLYEGTKPSIAVYPTFAVIPTQEPLFEALNRTGGDFAMVVHGGQKIRMHKPLDPSGTLVTQATIRGLYDLKKLAQVVVDTTTTHDGELVFETTWSIFYRGAGGFGGPRPVSDADEVVIPKGKAPDFVHVETIAPEQALLYRLSGDYNPLHADPAFAASVGFPQGPILHGLCTYGFVARAVVRNLCGGDARKLKAFSAQFRKPVWPGETLITQGYVQGNGKVALVASIEGKPDPVLTAAYAEIV